MTSDLRSPTPDPRPPALIDVNLATWPNHPQRLEYFQHLWSTLKNRLAASRHELRFHASAEGESDPRHPWMGKELTEFCRAEGIDLHWRVARADLGANMNAALRLGGAPHVFLVQDDFELLRPCDLSLGVELLDAEPTVDLIRYGWPPMTSFAGDMRGWPLVDIRGDWPYGDEPQLRRRTFALKWGWFTEGGRHASSESNLLWQLVRGNARIVVADLMYFGNCGAVSAVPVDREYRAREIGR